MNNKTTITLFVAMACIVSGPTLAAYKYKNKRVKDAGIYTRVNKAQAIIDQNSAQSTAFCKRNWMNRITIGGLANFDASWGSRTPIGTFGWYSNKDSSDININNANLLIDAKINCWIKGHMNLAYLGDQDKGFPIPLDKVGVRLGDSRLSVDEAYVDIGNFSNTPFYGRIGKQYVGFGDYKRYPIIKPITQMLTQTRATAVTVGAVTDMGVYANVSGFNGPTEKIANAGFVGWGKAGRNINNMTAKIGYSGSLHNIGFSDTNFNIDASWIANMYDINSLSPIYNYGQIIPFGYPNTVGGLAFHGDLAFGAFCLWANYVQSLKNMKLATPTSTILSSKIWAADVNAGYRFQTLGRESKINASYQFTGGADKYPLIIPNMQLPKDRFQLGYDVDAWKYTNLGIAWAHDVNYSNDLLGLNKHSDQIVGRLSVQF